MRITHLLFATLTVAAVNGCAKDGTDNHTTSQAARTAPADNTAKNERDREGERMVPTDQKENELDLGITQKIRQDVVGHEALSMSAKNVKIITADGVVTLRGPVTNADEKQAIAAIAQKVDGVKRVDNQLEIAAN